MLKKIIMLAFVSICEITLPHRPPQASRKPFVWNFIPLQTARSWGLTVKLFNWPGWNLITLQALKETTDAMVKTQVETCMWWNLSRVTAFVLLQSRHLASIQAQWDCFPLVWSTVKLYQLNQVGNSLTFYQKSSTEKPLAWVKLCLAINCGLLVILKLSHRHS